eukprot:429178-Rhodomonas_salina.2
MEAGFGRVYLHRPHQLVPVQCIGQLPRDFAAFSSVKSRLFPAAPAHTKKGAEGPNLAKLDDGDVTTGDGQLRATHRN